MRSLVSVVARSYFFVDKVKAVLFITPGTGTKTAGTVSRLSSQRGLHLYTVARTWREKADDGRTLVGGGIKLPRCSNHSFRVKPPPRLGVVVLMAASPHPDRVSSSPVTVKRVRKHLQIISLHPNAPGNASWPTARLYQVPSGLVSRPSRTRRSCPGIPSTQFPVRRVLGDVRRARRRVRRVL